MTKKGNEIGALLAKAKASTPANAALVDKIAKTQEDFEKVKKESAKRQDQLKKCLGDAQVREVVVVVVVVVVNILFPKVIFNGILVEVF